MTENEHLLHRDLAREKKAVKLAAFLHRAGFTPETLQHLDSEYPREFRLAAAKVADITPPSWEVWERMLEIMAAFEHPLIDVDASRLFLSVVKR